MEDINIDDVSKRFENHLAVEDNFRIIFSGKFGIGKTFFLKNFFEERKEVYNTILLSPVNYVVSSNEDIFELIKADIIKDLFFTGKIDLKKLPEDNTLQKISNFVESKSAVIGNFMLKFIAKLSTSSEIPKKVIDAIGNIYKNYQTETNKKKPEEMTRSEELMEYWADIEEKIGNIYEHNYVTKVINTFLEEIKKENKKNVLIIDDLDRIDPEHIFRILNILSAHNNQFDSRNKFAFDHVVLVCDLDNIKNIYFHKYGKAVDFDGYIDKFYSASIHEFTNKNAIAMYISIMFEQTEDNKAYLIFLNIILQNLVRLDLLTVRKLLKCRHYPNVENFILQKQSRINEETNFLHERPKFIKDIRNLHVDSEDLKILQFFKLMTFVYGDFNSFYNNMVKLKSTFSKINYAEIKELISFIALQKHIAIETGDDLFFTKYFSGEGGHRYLSSVNWPSTSCLGRNFRINLQWNQGNMYDGTESYFKSAIAQDQSSHYSDESLKINLSEIFKIVEEIALHCLEKKYFHNAGIYFKENF